MCSRDEIGGRNGRAQTERLASQVVLGRLPGSYCYRRCVTKTVRLAQSISSIIITLSRRRREAVCVARPLRLAAPRLCPKKANVMQSHIGEGKPKFAKEDRAASYVSCAEGSRCSLTESLNSHCSV